MFLYAHAQQPSKVMEAFVLLSLLQGQEAISHHPFHMAKQDLAAGNVLRYMLSKENFDLSLNFQGNPPIYPPMPMDNWACI